MLVIIYGIWTQSRSCQEKIKCTVQIFFSKNEVLKPDRIWIYTKEKSAISIWTWIPIKWSLPKTLQERQKYSNTASCQRWEKPYFWEHREEKKLRALTPTNRHEKTSQLPWVCCQKQNKNLTYLVLRLMIYTEYVQYWNLFLIW